MCFGSPAHFPLIPLFKSEGKVFHPVLPSTNILQLSSRSSCSSNQCFQSFTYSCLEVLAPHRCREQGSFSEDGRDLSQLCWPQLSGESFPPCRTSNWWRKVLLDTQQWHEYLSLHTHSLLLTTFEISPFYVRILVCKLWNCVQDKNHSHFPSINICTSEWKCKDQLGIRDIYKKEHIKPFNSSNYLS